MEAVVLEMMSTELVAVAMGRDGLVADTSQACGELRYVKMSPTLPIKKPIIPSKETCDTNPKLYTLNSKP